MNRPPSNEAARDAIPALCGELEAARAEVERLGEWREECHSMRDIGVRAEQNAHAICRRIREEKAALREESDRLRKLLAEACEVGQRHTRALRAIMPNADRVVADDERLAEKRPIDLP